VYDRLNRFLGRLDLAFPEVRFAVEYDGEWHQEGDQPERDARRRAAFYENDWHFLIVTKNGLYKDIARVIDAVRAGIRGQLPRFTVI